MSIAEAYQLFCTERFPLPTEKDVRDLETRISVSFPADYRLFLLQYNGGFFNEPQITPPIPECPVDRLTFLSGIRATHRSAELGRPGDLAIFDDNDPPQVVPIGYTIMGNLILLVTHPEGYGRILLRTFDESFWLADGIEDFFELLRTPPPDD
jgi:hypothetical protein